MNHSTLPMVLSMILAGYASTMNVWIDKLDDFRFSLNDTYMVGLMIGWMFFFMGLFTHQWTQTAIGLACTLLFFVCIRMQLFISQDQYLQGMIPHHSMAILMSKRLQTKSNSIQPLLKNIIKTQEKEITFMKKSLCMRV